MAKRKRVSSREMRTVVIPVYVSRVAPVFDFCTKALLVTMADGSETERNELLLRSFSLSERATMIRKVGATDLICCGISNVLHTILESSGVHVVPGIAGQVEEVLAAFMADRLDQPHFRMPGHRTPLPADPA